MLPAVPIERVEAPDRRAFQRWYVARRRPVVVRGLVEGWPARRRWSTGDLRQRFGDAQVPVLPVRCGVVQVDPRRGLVTTPMALGALMDRLEADEASAYMMARLDQLPVGLRAEVGDFPYCRRAPWKLCKVWFSARGTRSSLHWDINDNLHAQIVGSKRFTLFAPEDSPNLYPGRLFAGVPNASRVDLDAVDLQRFPRVARARPHVCELAPGETLFLPRGWWHHVATLEASLTVNVWWATGARLAVTAAAGAFKRLWGVSR